MPLIFAAFDQVDPRLVPDGAGGAIIVWTDPRDPARGPPIALETTSPLAPGPYFARVRQGGASARVRVTVLR